MLSIKNLSVHYGGIHALRGISFDVPAGKIVTLIGANGAGKSTTLNSIVGLVKADGGSVSWNGREMRGLKTRNIVKSGVVLVPEGAMTRQRLPPIWSVFLLCFHVLKSVTSKRLARFRAASSKCWRWGAR